VFDGGDAEEDRRRLCRERQVLIDERISHVNRIKGLLLAQGICGYALLRRNRRSQLEALRTGDDGRALPEHVKAQISRELDRLELLLAQIKAVEAERNALLAAMVKVDGEQVQASHPLALLLGMKGIGV
jgi:transposase